MSLSRNLPQATRGYDCDATDALIKELAGKRAELESECEQLREKTAQVEADLARHRMREELLSKPILSAGSFARTMREEARREAELILRKAAAEALKRRATAERIARDREDAERELLRLRQLTEEMQIGLASFLKTSLQQLWPEGEDEAQPKADQTPQPPSAADIDQVLASALEAALQQEKR